MEWKTREFGGISNSKHMNLTSLLFRARGRFTVANTNSRGNEGLFGSFIRAMFLFFYLIYFSQSKSTLDYQF